MKKRKIINLRKPTTIIVLLLFLFTTGGVVPAQESGPISMDFQEAALKDVLKIFSQQAGLNFVATDNIEERKITLYLDGVTVQDALNSIMQANNLSYDQAPGSSVFIVKESGKSKIEFLTRVYTLSFARVSGEKGAGKDGDNKASDIKSILENLLSAGEDGEKLGNIVVDRRTNSIIVSAIPTDIPIIEETIKKLDAITPQALIEAEIVEIRTGALKKLGLEWGDSQGAFVRFSGPTKITHFPFIRERNPFSKSLLGSVTESTSTTTTNDVTTTATDISQTPTLGTLSLAEFSVVLRALENENMAKYLAKPRIMALNNETAEINITADTTIGVKKTSVTDTGEVIEEAERTETGISLKVTPTINQQGYITMTIEPSVSRAVQSPLFTNFADPTKRSAKTTVMVKNGQTIAIGGLLKTDDEDNDRSVPGLSSIPLLGNLFKSKGKIKINTELIVFITAHSITGMDDIYKMKEGQYAEPSVKRPKQPVKTGPVSREPSLSQNIQAEPIDDTREAEIQKTVMRLRKKRELSGTR